MVTLILKLKWIGEWTTWRLSYDPLPLPGLRFDCGEGCGGRGGIVGEHGPVRIREEKEKLKAAKKAQRHSKDRDSLATKEIHSEENEQKPGEADQGAGEASSKSQILANEKLAPNGHAG